VGWVWGGETTSIFSEERDEPMSVISGGKATLGGWHDGASPGGGGDLVGLTGGRRRGSGWALVGWGRDDGPERKQGWAG
jgi:hypothetical protein